jgi:hypothetical protein
MVGLQHTCKTATLDTDASLGLLYQSLITDEYRDWMIKGSVKLKYSEENLPQLYILITIPTCTILRLNPGLLGM